MATQGERQNYNWRPNDNSSTTLTRYSLEAEHWTKAFRSAAVNNRPADFSGTLGTVGLVLQLVINLIWLIFYGIGSLFVWLFGNKEGGKFDMPLPTNIPTDDEITRMYGNDKNFEEINIYE
tara:strand:+ start:976 stop:1338 length:363 start_codon:yes stop_codon:yes gene_type:complete